MVIISHSNNLESRYAHMDSDIFVKKGDRIGQAIFQKYLVTDDDIAQGERTGGFGSTNK